jgi:hypothetical protein
MALTLSQEAPIKGECLLRWWGLEQGQVASLSRHCVEHRPQLLKVRFGELRYGDVHAVQRLSSAACEGRRP